MRMFDVQVELIELVVSKERKARNQERLTALWGNPGDWPGEKSRTGVTTILLDGVPNEGLPSHLGLVNALPNSRRGVGFKASSPQRSHSLIHPFICPSTHPPIHPFIHSLAHSFICHSTVLEERSRKGSPPQVLSTLRAGRFDQDHL